MFILWALRRQDERKSAVSKEGRRDGMRPAGWLTASQTNKYIDLAKFVSRASFVLH